MQTEIIDLTTPKTKRTIRLDSGTYRFRSVYDLTLEETERIDRMLPRFLELAMKGYARTPKESKEFGRLCNDACTVGLAEGKAADAGPAGRAVLADFFFDFCLNANLRLRQIRDTMATNTTRGRA